MPYAKDDDIEEVRVVLGEYGQFLAGKAEGTVDAYLRTVHQLIRWVAQLPGNAEQFQPRLLTKSTVERYLAHLEQEGLSLHHRARVKSTISNFANFLIEEKGLLQRNPTRGIELPPMPMHAPQELSDEQRSIMRSLIEQADDRRGAALFALGYWAGFRVSEISWLQVTHTHVGPEKGWLQVGEKGSKEREIDLMSQASQPLHDYLQATRDIRRTYVFISQRSARLTEEGIYYWFRMLKAHATANQWEVIADLTFNDLRHDFAHRAREAGWSLEEVACYLGDVTKQGAPAIQSTIPYTQISREQVKHKLKDIKG